MPPKKELSEVLTSSHSHSYVSQSGLAAVLKSIKENGLPSTASRSGIKRARDAVLPASFWLAEEVEMEDGLKKQIQLCHPIQLLQYMVAEVDAFASFFAEKLRAHQNSEDSPWSISLYSDEIVPGNALKPRNDRKLVACYWSFGQFDGAVGHEDVWHHIVAVRSSVVRSMKSGWSQLFKITCGAFFKEPLDVSKGVVLNIKGHGVHLFFAKVGLLVGDEPSLKGCWSTKGASGSLPCMFCKNVTLAHLQIAQNDASRYFVAHTETDLSKIIFQDDNSMLQSVQTLATSFGQCSKASFARTEQALGLQYAPEGARWCNDLINNQLVAGPISITQYDFMHTYFVSGIWNTEAGLLLQAVKDVVTVAEADQFLQRFTWPLHWNSRGVTGKKSLYKFVADGSEVKCSASEGVSLYPVFRLLVMDA